MKRIVEEAKDYLDQPENKIVTSSRSCRKFPDFTMMPFEVRRASHDGGTDDSLGWQEDLGPTAQLREVR